MWLKYKNTDFKHVKSQVRYKMSYKETKRPTKLWYCRVFCMAQLRKLVRLLPMAAKHWIIFESFLTNGLAEVKRLTLFSIADGTEMSVGEWKARLGSPRILY